MNPRTKKKPQKMKCSNINKIETISCPAYNKKKFIFFPL